MHDNLQHTSSPLQECRKHFYNRFKTERAAFQKALQYISLALDKSEMEQYVSLLLNRLLFLYFLQKQGLFDQDKNYLSHHLQLIQNQKPDTFYRSFLLPLFHEVLTTTERSAEQQRQFGVLPYLGQGLFTLHPLERQASAFNIPDTAFTQLFAFFACFSWHLDETVSDAESITPTALGHIFEQYVNQQQMGAYYTQDDVTMYIARNTIIPHLFDALAQHVSATPQLAERIWGRLREAPDRYISKMVRTQAYVPGETEREYQERQCYYQGLQARLVAGGVTTIDDFITFNLDIQQFACDVLLADNDPTFLHVCYERLKSITVLDPTCGSGAFLFAALSVLFSLYEACLSSIDRTSDSSAFQEVFAKLESLQQRRSFILKSILTHNLYGIDIMEDATETCRLRLLLAFIAHTQHSAEIEPLPQLLHTIQTGNVLVDLPELGGDAESSIPPQALEASPSWQIAFKDILRSGGFDVIIGNPPYVEYNEKKLSYVLGTFSTRSCGNLYTCVVERSRQLLSLCGRHGMILPLAAFATRNMQPFLEAFRRWFPVSWVSFYHFRPSMLFSGGKVASIATAIYLARTYGAERRFSTQLFKWPQQQRALLFSRLTYCQIVTPADFLSEHYYPKFGSQIENMIMRKLLKHEPVKQYLATESNDNTMYYRSAGGLYWKVFVNFSWPYETTSNKLCYFRAEFDRDIFVALFNSSLFWWYYTVTFDTFNLKDYMLFGFRFSYPQDPAILTALRVCSRELMHDFQKHARHLKRGDTGSYTIYARKSKAIIDRIDRTLAHHYGFTPAELDFILHYDIKYRISLHESVES